MKTYSDLLSSFGPLSSNTGFFPHAPPSHPVEVVGATEYTSSSTGSGSSSWIINLLLIIISCSLALQNRK